MALRKYIASFGGSNAVPELGSAPPCRSYRNLVLLSDLEADLDKVQGCTSRPAITAILEKCNPFKLAIRDLVSMAKASATRLENTIKDLDKERKLPPRMHPHRPQQVQRSVVGQKLVQRVLLYRSCLIQNSGASRSLKQLYWVQITSQCNKLTSTSDLSS